jgi:hypothetical protein
MSYELMIDWSTSVEQQVDDIDALLKTARSLMRQIRDKKDTSPELITDQSYQCFQTAICSMHELIRELEDNPLYRPALLQLCNRQREQRRRLIQKYFGVGDTSPLTATSGRTSPKRRTSGHPTRGLRKAQSHR